MRTLLAVLLLGAGVGLVVYLARRTAPPTPPSAQPAPIDVVRQVAARHGCAPSDVVAESSLDRQGAFPTITVHAPRVFPVERFVLDLQAAAHNLGGRLEPQPLLEKGGYGLARLDGRIGSARCRVLVLGEVPPPVPLATPTGAARVGAAAARLAIVLDDAGATLDVVGEVAQLPPAVAVAVLPNATHSAEVAKALAAQGREVLLHMPMEPLANHGAGPGEGAIEVGLPVGEVEARLGRALAIVASARGVNNHMGSRATADAEAMGAVMAVLRTRGLYFLDSRTTAETVAESVARSTGVPTLHRDVFLDVVSEPEAVLRALEQAVARARVQGSALAIGHVHPVTISLLARELPGLAGEVTLVRPSQLLHDRD